MWTLGSLFDGSGGFPLGGVINGIRPLWSSEIEPYPLRVTAARFPDVMQLGDVTKIDGTKIPTVDIITFGSPCQDLSVAGKQKGIHEGERSSLFFEAIRIAKEMRESDRAAGRADVHVRPRFLVWENVPGAFSSNKGEDFRSVLEALGGIAEEGLSIPRPAKGKWNHAGCVVGNGWSIAWRVYDAQYWGVPQRRKRIYLVADFASERAGEILFEREGLRGDPAQGRETRERTPDDAQGGAGGSDYAFHLQQDPIGGYVSPCIGAQHQATVGIATGFKGNQGAKAGGIGWQEGLACTLNANCAGLEPTVCYAMEGNTIDRQSSKNGKGWCEGVSATLNTQDKHGVVFPNVARTLMAEHDSSPCIDRGQNVVCVDCRNMRSNGDLSGTLQAKSNGGISLNYVNPVVYSSGSFGGMAEGCGTLGTGSRATAEMVAVYDTTQITSPQNRSNPKPGDPSFTLGTNQHPPLCVYPEKTGALCANSHPGSYTGQDAFNDMLPVEMVCKQTRKYIVRRLTPLECCRLQGFPDRWEHGVEGSDSARYKMWGNGIALPCAADVLGRIARAMAEQWCKEM